MNRFLLLLYAFCCCLKMSAEEISYILRVELKDGTNNEYVLADRPQISFEKESVVFLCKRISTSYKKKDITNFVFGDSKSTGIYGLRDGDTRINYIIKEGKVILEGVTEKEDIKIFSISGQLHHPIINNEGNKVVVMLASLPEGYYIINIGNKQSIKVLKK